MPFGVFTFEAFTCTFVKTFARLQVLQCIIKISFVAFFMSFCLISFICRWKFLFHCFNSCSGKFFETAWTYLTARLWRLKKDFLPLFCFFTQQKFWFVKCFSVAFENVSNLKASMPSFIITLFLFMVHDSLSNFFFKSSFHSTLSTFYFSIPCEAPWIHIYFKWLTFQCICKHVRNNFNNNNLSLI